MDFGFCHSGPNFEKSHHGHFGPSLYSYIKMCKIVELFFFNLKFYDLRSGLDPEILRPDFGFRDLGLWLAFYWYFVSTD